MNCRGWTPLRNPFPSHQKSSAVVEKIVTAERELTRRKCHATTAGRLNGSVRGKETCRAGQTMHFCRFVSPLSVCSHCIKGQLLCAAPKKFFQGYRADLPDNSMANPSVQHRSEVCRKLRDTDMALQSAISEQST